MTLTENMLQSIRERLGQLMNDYSLSQKALAIKCGLSENDVSSLVGKNSRAKKTMSGEQLFAIAEAFDVSIDWLVGRTDIREMAHSKEESKQDFDYSKVTYGDLNKMLAFAAARGVLQIIPPTDKTGNVTLLILDGDTGEFLRKLRNKAIDVITDPDETEFLTGWFDKKCADSEPISSWGRTSTSFFSRDKYHGAFPWRYEKSMNDYSFDFYHAEWRTTDPSDERGCVDSPTCLVDYAPYRQLYDGIVGYYYNSGSFPNPPQEKKQQESSNAIESFMNIPDSIDDELPFN